jgi:alkylhydroperoxidase/carboxymuconolactone decarboxylase family protein YurZ
MGRMETVRDAPERQAWVSLPSDEEIRAATPAGGASAYDFGFMMGMPRLRMAHPRIGALFGPLFREIMFGPGELSRAEREMVAGVAAAAQDCHY